MPIRATNSLLMQSQIENKKMTDFLRFQVHCIHSWWAYNSFIGSQHALNMVSRRLENMLILLQKYDFDTRPQLKRSRRLADTTFRFEGLNDSSSGSEIESEDSTLAVPQDYIQEDLLAEKSGIYKDWTLFV